MSVRPSTTGRWTGYQKLLIFGTALTIILDGIDNQILPNAIPYIAPEWFPTWHSRRERAAPFGAGVGPCGHDDRRPAGRRHRRQVRTPDGSALERDHLRVLTFLVAFIDSVSMLSALRFLAGVGLGGAMPNAASLASEYVPRRQRPFAVTLTIVCIPLGGFVASTMTRLIAPQFGWQGALHYRRHRPAGPGGRSVQGAARVAALPGRPARALARAHEDDAPYWPHRSGRRGVCRGRGRRWSGQEGGDPRSVRAAVSARHAGAVRVVLLLPDGELRRDSAADVHAARPRWIHASRRRRADCSG